MPYPSLLCCLTCWLLAGSSGNSQWTSGARDNLVFFFLLSSLSLTPPCVDSKRSRSPCVPAPCPHAEKHVRVLPAYTETFRTHTRGRFGSTHGGDLSVPHHTAYTHHDHSHSHSHNDTIDHTTDTTCTHTHNTTQHNITHNIRERQRKKAEKEREEKTKEERQDEGEDKTRRKRREDPEIKRR